MDYNSELQPHINTLRQSPPSSPDELSLQEEQTRNHSILNSTLGDSLERPTFEQSVTVAREGREEEALQLYNRARSLVAECYGTASLATLKTAIFLIREALVRWPGPILCSESLKDMETALYEVNRSDDLHESQFLDGETFRLWKNDFMRVTGTMVHVKPALDGLGYSQELNEVASLHPEALEQTLAPHSEGPKLHDNFSIRLQEITSPANSANSLEGEILLYRHTLELSLIPYRDRVCALTNLAFALRTRFLQTCRREDIDEAISLYGNVCEAFPVHHPQRFSTLSNLAFALATRSQLSGQDEDLEEAISLHREALKLVPLHNPHRSDCINDLAVGLTARFRLSGQPEDLEEVISLHREALKLRPEPHLYRSASLRNLANALTARFEQLFRREDMDEAISLHRDAVRLRPAPHHDRPTSLNDIATTLVTKYKQSGRVEDVDEAISLRREALELQPVPHPGRSASLYHLACTLNIRLEHSGGDEKKLLAAMSLHKEALELLPVFVDEAIDEYHRSFNALVRDHPAVCTVSANLGRAFRYAYSHTRKPEYLHKAADAFRIAVTREAPPAYEPSGVSKEWASHTEAWHQSALDVYHTAIQLLPHLATFGLDLPSRRQGLTSGSDCLVRDAAACAIRSGQYEKAVELLEDGRCRVWDQLLYLGSPVTVLRDVAPELEQKLRQISLAVMQGSLRDVPGQTTDDSFEMNPMEREAFPFRRLNDEWVMTLEKVRQLDGFEDFLRTSQVSRLLGAAAAGPVVILNASYAGCAALILTPTNIQHVPLPMGTVTDLTRLVQLIQLATQQNDRDFFLSQSTCSQVYDLFEQHDIIFQYILAKLWVSVVRPIIRFLDLKKSDAPPNLWWCLTGLFNFLPIHAAGSYRTVDPECVSDYVISSYTPTIRTLLRDDPPPANACKMMVVTQPSTPGQTPLPDTLDELGRIKAHVPIKELVSLVGGSVNDVIFHLPTTSIVHFACHGQQNAANPLESAFVLSDGQLKASEIMQQSIPNGRLAFLSACHTATGDQNHPDEILHLGSALLFAGFRGVIATMWNIHDEDGPKIADAFYEYLFRVDNSDLENTFQSDTNRAAQALHFAIAKLRSEKVSFKRWVPYIHFGR